VCAIKIGRFTILCCGFIDFEGWLENGNSKRNVDLHACAKGVSFIPTAYLTHFLFVSHVSEILGEEIFGLYLSNQPTPDNNLTF